MRELRTRERFGWMHHPTHRILQGKKLGLIFCKILRLKTERGSALRELSPATRKTAAASEQKLKNIL